MSTSFEIFPGSVFIPTYGEILELSNKKLHQFLHDFKIYAQPQIAVTLRSKDLVEAVNLQSTAKWDDNWYAWFSVFPVLGGTDAHLISICEDAKKSFYEEVMDKRQMKDLGFILSCLESTYYWSLSRTMGQSATINLAYGLIASSIAELTNGFIYSSDGAWDYQKFPATVEEFDTFYFRPELATNPDYKDFAERCIKAIPEELANNNHYESR